MKSRLQLSLIFIFCCCLAITTTAQITPETALDRPEIETIIGLHMPGGSEIMSSVTIFSDVDNSINAVAIDNDAIENQPDATIYDNISANVNGDNPIDVDDEIDKEELIIRKGVLEAFDKN